MSNADKLYDHIANLIRKSGAFPTADDMCIRALGDVAVWVSIPGGNTLFSQGEASQTMYIIVNGLLGVYISDSAGKTVMAGRVGAGELIGEMGCVAGEPRSATIRALRTSEVLCISWKDFELVARAHPVLLESLCRTVVKRLRNVQEGRSSEFKPRTFCLLPHGDDRGVSAFADSLVSQLNAFKRTFLVTKEKCKGYTTEQLAALEAAYDCVVYLAENGRTSWSQLCLRQADTILVVVRGSDTPIPIEPFGEGISAGISVDVVLLWQDQIIPGKTAPWLDLLRPRMHFHVRSHSDAGRAARLLMGNGLGLVLSGGGARGLAHIGVARALAEHGVAIDAISGTSIGALIGSSIAMEWEHQSSRDRAHQFSRRHPLFELVFPRQSLLSGRNLRNSLDKWYADLTIEETPIRYTCVTANLNTCSATAHKRGKLKTWVRASSSLPGIFPPVMEDGGMHVDGGVINNLPTDLIRSMGVGFVIAVDVGYVASEQLRDVVAQEQAVTAQVVPSILEILMRVGTIGSDVRGPSARQQSDVLLVPKVQSLSLLNWRAYDQAIKLGYDCTMEKIDQIRGRIPDALDTHIPPSL
jgi:NTE family protein